jgi:branched-subunit amino acid transport protein
LPDRLEAKLTEVWITVAAVGVVTIAFKSLGPVAIGGRSLPPRLLGVVELLAPALLAALVVTQVFASERALVVDARAVGLAAAVVGLIARAPVLVVVVAAAAAAAAARALT